MEVWSRRIAKEAFQIDEDRYRRELRIQDADLGFLGVQTVLYMVRLHNSMPSNQLLNVSTRKRMEQEERLSKKEEKRKPKRSCTASVPDKRQARAAMKPPTSAEPMRRGDTCLDRKIRALSSAVGAVALDESGGGMEVHLANAALGLPAEEARTDVEILLETEERFSLVGNCRSLGMHAPFPSFPLLNV